MDVKSLKKLVISESLKAGGGIQFITVNEDNEALIVTCDDPEKLVAHFKTDKNFSYRPKTQFRHECFNHVSLMDWSVVFVKPQKVYHC